MFLTPDKPREKDRYITENKGSRKNEEHRRAGSPTILQKVNRLKILLLSSSKFRRYNHGITTTSFSGIYITEFVVFH